MHWKASKDRLGIAQKGDGQNHHIFSAEKKEPGSQELYGASLVDVLARSSEKNHSLVMQDGTKVKLQN